jgi:hypothetical protein
MNSDIRFFSLPVFSESYFKPRRGWRPDAALGASVYDPAGNYTVTEKTP